MSDRSNRSTSSTDTAARPRRDEWKSYRRGEYPTFRLVLETVCPDCRAASPPYQHVLEHEPCGCIRPFDAFADAGGCPNCGGVDEAAVIARLYTCPVCGSTFDTPSHRLIARQTPVSTAASTTAFEWGPPLERWDPDPDAGPTPSETELVSTASGGGDR